MALVSNLTYLISKSVCFNKIGLIYEDFIILDYLSIPSFAYAGYVYDLFPSIYRGNDRGPLI